MSTDATEDYVRPDGTVDFDKIPETMTMVDANEDIVVDAEGRPVLLDARRMLDPTAPDPFIDKYPAGETTEIVTPEGERITVEPGGPIPRADLIEEFGISYDE